MSKSKKPGVFLRHEQKDPKEYPLAAANNLMKIAAKRRALGVPDSKNWQFLEQENANNYTLQDGKIIASGKPGESESAQEQRGDSSSQKAGSAPNISL